MTATLAEGLTCAMPFTGHDRVVLGHGSGGKLSAALLRERFLPLLGNPYLAMLGDGAVVPGPAATGLVVSTDTFVVSPLEFPGGNIGSLAVHGTLNDLAMMGAQPKYLTAGFVLEEGLPFDLLDRVLESMAAAATAARVPIITGDTKVVERGKADGMYINTTGIGFARPSLSPAPGQALLNDAVIVSGPIGRHGIAILSARENLGVATDVVSDCASLGPLVELLAGLPAGSIRVLRDPTRGGLASALNEIAAASDVGIELDEWSLSVPPSVLAACELLGFDPLYVANEGIMVAVVAPSLAREVVDRLKAHPLGRDAALVGRVVNRHPGMVTLRTAMGGVRVVDMLPGDQLPRIC